MDRRNLGKMLIIIGIIAGIAGLAFTAQSKSIVGPESSFMYNSPQWTTNGYLIFGLGVAIIFSGIVIWISRKLSYQR
jgi:Zn-dependent protease with chaperone function